MLHNDDRPGLPVLLQQPSGGRTRRIHEGVTSALRHFTEQSEGKYAS
jgi:hypothetical protein